MCPFILTYRAFAATGKCTLVTRAFTFHWLSQTSPSQHVGHFFLVLPHVYQAYSTPPFYKTRLLSSEGYFHKLEWQYDATLLGDSTCTPSQVATEETTAVQIFPIRPKQGYNIDMSCVGFLSGGDFKFV